MPTGGTLKSTNVMYICSNKILLSKKLIQGTLL